MNFVQKILLSLMIIMIISCNGKIEKAVCGVWIIDKIQYKNVDIKTRLLANAITIRTHYTCDLPIVKIEDNHTDRQKGKWSIEKKNGQSYLIIKSSNQLFNTNFKIEKIWKEHDNESQGDFYKIILSSEDLKFQCTRDASDII